MPKRKDFNTILIIGSGPIVIGQACEFDYSGTQACKALREEGYRVVLINSNPATIMTDPETADAIYLEPIETQTIEKIIRKEKVQAILPTVGGQTSLNALRDLQSSGIIEKYNITVIGATAEAIEKAENRKAFEQAMHELGYHTAQAYHVSNIKEASKVIQAMPLPLIIRPSFTLGGSGGSIAFTKESYLELVSQALNLSPIHEVVIERSLLGWREYELEVMRDCADNAIIICSIENLDPMGIHTGDSITVAPQQTLSDKQYQELRNMSLAIIRKIGVDTGGCNIQFAVHPEHGEVKVIEMNPRVSRSSALASKATGFPIAKIAAKLAVGYRLDEIPNDITQSTLSCFEPSIDYVVVKLPRFAFEKFKHAKTSLNVQMKSVGETMAIGRTFAEAMQKALRGLETGLFGFDGDIFAYKNIKGKSSADLKIYIESKRSKLPQARKHVSDFHFNRLASIKDLFYFNESIQAIYDLCNIDYYFLNQLKRIYQAEAELREKHFQALAELSLESLREYKQKGFSDIQLAHILGYDEQDLRKKRHGLGLRPSYKVVDTCAAEFEAQTPYYYSSYDEEDEFQQRLLKSQNLSLGMGRVAILGGGPNRIGQGIEFDTMCVQVSLAIQKMGYETIMINSNPETVSTDYDVSSILFLEPLFTEDVLEILYASKVLGSIIHFGGQTPLNLASILEENNFKILGTSSQSILQTEDRKAFKKILDQLKLAQPNSGIVRTSAEAQATSKAIGYPVLLRPSFVLGGRAMEIVHDEKDLDYFFEEALRASLFNHILIDEYLKNAQEVDLDLICDGENIVICGLIEHVEEAGVHSGDSACILPPKNLSPLAILTMARQAKSLALRLGILGFLNIQFAVSQGKVYVLEANPRGSRTVPFVCKSTGIPWVALGAAVIMGQKLSPEDLQKDFVTGKAMSYFTVKEAVFPFDKFPEEDILLGPEMKSTGEVMGIGKNEYEAFYKALTAAGMILPESGGICISLKTKEFENFIPACHELLAMGYKLFATKGTHRFLTEHGVESCFVFKLGEGSPSILDKIENHEISLIFNTPIGRKAKQSDIYLRLAAKKHKIGVFTSFKAMIMATYALKEKRERKSFPVYSTKDLL